MIKMTTNELTHEGLRRMKIIGDVEICAAWYQAEVAVEAHSRVVSVPKYDPLLGLFSLELTWPVFGPYDVFYDSPKGFRRFMFVNFCYAERVSNCIELARLEFFARTHFAPRDAYVKDLPEKAVIGMDVHGCILQEAEWMPAGCVAVGGRDG